MAEIKKQSNCFTSTPKMDGEIEDISEIIGSWGRWQSLVTLIMFLFAAPSAYYNMGMPFLAPQIDHWCRRPTEYSNLSVEEWKNLSIPYVEVNGVAEYSKCHMYQNQSYTSLLNGNSSTVPCTSWEYDHSFFTATLTEEWDLVCERSWMPSFSSSLYFLGYLVTCSTTGQLSDRFGRKPLLFISLLCASVSGLVCTFAPNFWVFAAFRFLLAYGRASTYLVLYVFLMEVVGKRHRIVITIMGKFAWALSQMILPGIAWGLRNWFYTELTCTLFYFALLPIWWFFYESPRWLLTKNRIDEAEAITRMAVKMNRLKDGDLRIKLEKLKENASKENQYGDSENATLFDILKTKNLRRTSAILYFLWMVNMFAYYGLSFTADDVGGNLFLFYFLSALVELPAALTLYCIQPKLGRRYSQMSFMIVCSLACLLSIVIPKDLSSVMFTLGVIGKFSLAGSTASLYLISSEVYPTVVRNVGLGSCSTMGRVGAIVAPFMKEAATSLHWTFPLALFGSLELIGTVLALFLPETKNIHLVDTLSQGEKIGSQTMQVIKRKSKDKRDGKSSTNESTITGS